MAILRHSPAREEFSGSFFSLFFHRGWPELESGLPAGSRAASRFTSIPVRKAKQLAFLSGKIFWQKFGQNWNRTSDTRIFSPLLYRLSYLALKWHKGVDRTF